MAEKESKVVADSGKSTSKKMVNDEPDDQIVRCEFKLLQSEESLIESIKLRGATQGVLLNKSEVLRAELKALGDKQISK